MPEVGFRRHARLRMKAIPADRTAQFDLTESSHKTSSRYMKSWKEISVPVFSRESGYIALVQNFLAEYFLASKSAPRSVITHDPVVDAD